MIEFRPLLPNEKQSSDSEVMSVLKWERREGGFYRKLLAPLNFFSLFNWGFEPESVKKR